MKKNNLISIIIVNFNGKPYLYKCLKSIHQQSYPSFEIILVDNASSDKSVELVKKNFPEVKIIQLKRNFGFALANNIGYKKSQGGFVFLLNNDTYLEKDTLKNLLDGFSKIKKAGILQPKIRLMDNPTKLDECGSFLTNSGFLYHYGIYKDETLPKYNQSFPIYSPKGAAMMIKREIIEKIGLFDPDYFAYFEETDFTGRAWLAGYQTWYFPKAIIYHKMGATSTKMKNSFIQYHSFKNRLNSYLKNLEPFSLIKLLSIHLFFNLMIGLIFLLKLNFKNFLAINQAFFWNILNFKTTWQKRTLIQKYIRVRTDRDIFKTVRRNPRPSYYYYLVKGLDNYAD